MPVFIKTPLICKCVKAAKHSSYFTSKISWKKPTATKYGKYNFKKCPASETRIIRLINCSNPVYEMLGTLCPNVLQIV